jgi:hypothetical protein
MKNRLLCLASTFAITLGIGAMQPVRAGEILVNGGFENVTGGVPNYGYILVSGNDLPGWTIAPGHYGTLHENPGPWPTITGSYSLNTDGEGTNGNNVDIYQDFSTNAGDLYNFSFNWETWNVDAPESLLSVSITDLGNDSVVYNGLFNPFSVPSQVVQTAGATFIGDGDSYKLEIQETPQSGFNDNEYIVDNFSVNDTGPSSVPDSTTWSAEILSGVALLWLARRWKLAGAQA